MLPQALQLQEFEKRRGRHTVYLTAVAGTFFVVEALRFWTWFTDWGAVHFSERLVGSNAVAMGLAAIALIASDYYGAPRGRHGVLGFGGLVGGALANLCEYWSGAGVAHYAGLGELTASGGDVAAAAGLLLLAPSISRGVQRRLGLRRRPRRRNRRGLRRVI